MLLLKISGIITNECSSVALQSALLVLKGMKSKLLPSLVDHILQNGFPGITARHCDNYEELSDIPVLFHSNAALHLLEVSIFLFFRNLLSFFVAIRINLIPS